MKNYITNSAGETRQVGTAFGSALAPGDVVALSGDLGAGKTVFVQGVAAALGCTDEVASPTFTLVNEYGGTPPLYHFDVYRLQKPEPAACDWMDDYLFGDGVCLIEWAENVSAILPERTWLVEILKAPQRGEDYREIRIYPPDEEKPLDKSAERP